MTKKILLWIFVLLLLVTPILAPPPAGIQGATVFDKGLVIDAPTLPYAKIGEGYRLAFHVYNQTDGTLMDAGKGVNCSAHFFNLNGSHAFDQFALPHENHFGLN